MHITSEVGSKWLIFIISLCCLILYFCVLQSRLSWISQTAKCEVKLQIICCPCNEWVSSLQMDHSFTIFLKLGSFIIK